MLPTENSIACLSNTPLCLKIKNRQPNLTKEMNTGVDMKANRYMNTYKQTSADEPSDAGPHRLHTFLKL